MKIKRNMSSKEGQKVTKTKLQIRQRRIFSDTFKKEKVSDIASGLSSVKEICELYEVSRTAVYKWIYKYSPHYEQGTVQVVQMESEATKTKLLKSRVVELEAALGRKQLEIDLLTKLIELANKDLQIDIKKNYG